MVCALRYWHRPIAELRGCVSRGELKQPLRRSLPRPRGSYDCQKYNERHDALRDDAVETPCLKDTRLNVREVKSKDKPHERRYDEQAIAAHERENRNGCVTGNADSGYWNSVNYGVKIGRASCRERV